MATAESVLWSILKTETCNYGPKTQRNRAVDPREMFNQVRSDFQSKRWTRFVLAGIFVLGLVTWGHVLTTRGAARRPINERPQISVLSDPFVDQQQ